MADGVRNCNQRLTVMQHMHKMHRLASEKMDATHLHIKTCIAIRSDGNVFGYSCIGRAIERSRLTRVVTRRLELGNLTVASDSLTILDSLHCNPAAKHMRCLQPRRRHTECANYLRSGKSHGCSQTTIVQHADPQTAFAPRHQAQAAFVLPQVQHRRAAACNLSQLRVLHGPGHGRERRGGVVAIPGTQHTRG
jgi:hypothetical protein